MAALGMSFSSLVVVGNALRLTHLLAADPAGRRARASMKPVAAGAAMSGTGEMMP
jgi:hypothetical protein